MQVEDIYNAIIKDEEEKQEFYRWLGASLIGHECTRYIFLKFICAFNENFTGRILRVFRNGHEAEPRIGADLKLAGCEIFDEQLEIDAPFCKGHAGSTIDGKIKMPDGEVLLLEYKTAKSTAFKKYQKEPIKISNPRYYYQVQINMHLTGLKKAMWIVENKDTNELHIEYIDYDHQDACSKLSLMHKIVNEGFTGEKCSENPDYFQCKWCSANSICHGKKTPRMHCLTCCHSIAIEDGKFRCMLYQTEIPNEFLSKGCPEHVFHPATINLNMVDTGEYWVSYRLPTGELICNCSAKSFPKVDTSIDYKEILDSSEMVKRGYLYEN